MGFGKDGRGAIIYQRLNLSLGALPPDNIALSSGYGLLNDFRILRMEIFGYLEGFATGESGQVCFGLADGSLTNAEIVETITSVAVEPLGSNTEEAERPVWPIGMPPTNPASAGNNAPLSMSGQPLVWDRRWTFKEDQGWAWWVTNLGTANLTDGASLRILAKIFGVWVH